MRWSVLLVSAAVLAGCDDITEFGSCSNPRDFTDNISASGLTALLVDAEAGDLHVIGRSGINSVRVRARACANNRTTRNDTDFELYRAGETARLITYVPAYDRAWLDLVVEVPFDFDVDIYDLSGNIVVEDVYSVWINNASGHIDIFDIETDVIIDEDGSGDIDVRNIGGDFIVYYDRSGYIRYRNVHGRVLLP